jgi:ABC-type antimicrobial peptide transport system permease subunit
MYVNHRQSAPWQNAFVLRVSGAMEPAALVASVRSTARSIDPTVPLFDVATMDGRLGAMLAARSFSLALLGVFAGLALILAGLGVYGVIAYVVSQRAVEVGIRLALGARGTDVVWLFVRQGMVPVVIGLGAGLLGALALTRVMTSQLYGITTNDPLTYFASGLVLLAVALLACWLPARRAARVDPMVALRAE